MKRLPPWLRKPAQSLSVLHNVKSILRRSTLSTICESAKCPNINECFSKPTATFMILGEVCTRPCGFCSVEKLGGPAHGSPAQVDDTEPRNLALSAKEMGLKHVVITSVTRDDLPLGGAEHFANCIKEVRKLNPTTTVEVLIPDFNGNKDAIKVVVDAKPEILNHNLETVPRLYKRVRPIADYRQSLELLRFSEEMGVITKSGIMVGLGETFEEVGELLKDLKEVNIGAVTIGQYLQPTRKSLKVEEYVTPETFKKFEDLAKEIGIEHTYSGPFVRSSYNAGNFFDEIKKTTMKEVAN